MARGIDPDAGRIDVDVDAEGDDAGGAVITEKRLVGISDVDGLWNGGVGLRVVEERPRMSSGRVDFVANAETPGGLIEGAIEGLDVGGGDGGAGGVCVSRTPQNGERGKRARLWPPAT